MSGCGFRGCEYDAPARMCPEHGLEALDEFVRAATAGIARAVLLRALNDPGEPPVPPPNGWREPEDNADIEAES